VASLTRHDLALASRRARPALSRRHRRAGIARRAYPTWFAGGALGVYLLFVLVPGLLGIGLSFTNWNAYSTRLRWVGLRNFETLVQPHSFYLTAIENTVIFTVATIVLKTVLGLALAILLTSGVKRLAPLYRALIFVPNLLPMVAVGIVFKSILDPSTGLLNSTLRTLALGGLAQDWLGDIHLALWSVIGVDTWKGVGYIMVILIAGLLAIPREFYEAASCDGASSWQRFRHITLPMLRPVLAVTTVINLVYAMRVFDVVYVLTNGGPGYATQTVYTTIFSAFGLGQYGLATAFSSVVLVVMLALSFVIIRLVRRPGAAQT
jgi:raffinose/stachyose/melibiose transport system permease protein